MVVVQPVRAFFCVVPVEGITDGSLLISYVAHLHLLLAMDSTGHICGQKHKQKYLKLLG